MDEYELKEHTNGVVELRKAVKSYGDAINILDNLDMTVPAGTIYGLLGPSGCGKTTLLACILGRRKLNYGNVSVLGVAPGSGAGVPGPILGFMPQECCLIDELSIEETAYEYGAFYNMTNKEIKKRFDFLHDLLELPPKNRHFGNLSGGQQRRVSLMVALLHSPTLLVLDEPTVGLDPVLRTKVWDYLVELSNVHNTTVIITTHYVEEARRAHNIALMRKGKLLCEGGPEILLNQFQCTKIEDLFIKLSENQEAQMVVPDDKTLVSRTESPDKAPKIPAPRSNILKTQQALLTKNTRQYFRNPLSIYFTLGVCLQQFIILCFAVLYNSYGQFNVGVVNNEGPCTSALNITNTASCQYIKHLEDTEIKLKMVYFDSEEEAIDCVKETKCMIMMSVPSNFTEALYDRYGNGDYTNASEITFHEDNTLGLNWFLIREAIYTQYVKFIEEFLTEQNIPSNLGRTPIKFEKNFREVKVKKEGSLSFNYNVVPSMIIYLLFTSGSILASLVITLEMQMGIWDRLLATGVTTSEIFTSHVITQCFFGLLQAIETVVITVYIIKIQFVGDMFTFVVLNVLASFLGIAVGFLCSTVILNFIVCMYASCGVVSISLFVMGTAWPLESMPRLMYLVVYYLPLNAINRAVGYVLLWDLTLFSPKMLKEFIPSVLAVLCLFLFSGYALKMRKNFDN